MAKNTKSIEEQVEDWCKKQFKGQKYYTKTETINAEIASALEQAPSKQGGSGKNYPDIKCLLMANDGKRIPVMIEVKGRKGDLIKTTDSGDVDNYNKKGDPSYQNIAKYAVNGAVHYAHAILNFTETYKEVVAIGVNGYDEAGKIVYEVECGTYLRTTCLCQNTLAFMMISRSYIHPTPQILSKNYIRFLLPQKSLKKEN